MSKTKINPAHTMAAAILFGFLVLPVSHAQTIRPVISEYNSKVAKGRFELVNTGLVPLSVVLDPKRLSVSEKGTITYRPLDKNIQLKLSATSFRISPEQSYFVFYEARADVLPAWFVIYSSIGVQHKSDGGMNIRLDLPHTVYILPKHSVEESDVLISALGPTPDQTHVGFLVTNTGPWFGRVLSSELIGKGGNTQASGFPLFPHSARVVEVACTGSQTAATLRLRFKNFKIEAPLSEPQGSQPCAP